MTKVAVILFKGKQETYKKLLKRKWENVQFQVAWQSDLLKLSIYPAANRNEEPAHPYLNSWSHK